MGPPRGAALMERGCAGSVAVELGLSCPTACGIFPDQGLNPCPLHWQAEPQTLDHHGVPKGLSDLVFGFWRELPYSHVKPHILGLVRGFDFCLLGLF